LHRGYASHISKENSKNYLAEDDYFTRREKNQVRKMIERVYATPSQGKQYFKDLAWKECTRKSK
jgi:hypothetical protein